MAEPLNDLKTSEQQQKLDVILQEKIKQPKLDIIFKENKSDIILQENIQLKKINDIIIQQYKNLKQEIDIVIQQNENLKEENIQLKDEIIKHEKDLKDCEEIDNETLDELYDWLGKYFNLCQQIKLSGLTEHFKIQNDIDYYGRFVDEKYLNVEYPTFDFVVDNDNNIDNLNHNLVIDKTFNLPLDDDDDQIFDNSINTDINFLNKRSQDFILHYQKQNTIKRIKEIRKEHPSYGVKNMSFILIKEEHKNQDGNDIEHYNIQTLLKYIF